VFKNRGLQSKFREVKLSRGKLSGWRLWMIFLKRCKKAKMLCWSWVKHFSNPH